MQPNFPDGEPIVDFDYYYNFAKAIIPTITVDEVSALAKKHLNRKNMVIVAQGPSEGVKHITKEEAIAVLDKVESSNLEPYKDQVTEASLINEDLKGSKIIATKNYRNSMPKSGLWKMEQKWYSAKQTTKKTKYK